MFGHTYNKEGRPGDVESSLGSLDAPTTRSYDMEVLSGVCGRTFKKGLQGRPGGVGRSWGYELLDITNRIRLIYPITCNRVLTKIIRIIVRIPFYSP